MAKGQNYSRHQQKIIHRYYEHQDTIMTQKLGEIVTELYLCEAGETKKKAANLWERAEKALRKTDASPARIDKIVAGRDVKKLAELVNELAGGKADAKGKRR